MHSRQNRAEELVVGGLYSNDHIVTALKVSNGGGIRPLILDSAVRRMAVMTSVNDFRVAHENPYHDRLEGDTLTYTAAGKVGRQTLAGINSRIVEQKQSAFPIHGFIQIAGRRDKTVGPQRWKYLGLLQYLRHYPDTQLGSDGRVCQAWLFEFRIHSEVAIVPLALDLVLSADALASSGYNFIHPGDDEVDPASTAQSGPRFVEIERVRSALLALEARQFEYFIRDLLLHCGCTEVCVTAFSADGGVDVNAKAGLRMWLFANTLIQIQAKRWLHSVGRKEVAELRGSLKPFARGAVVTTGHFSRAAIVEAGEEGKNPVTLVDGYSLSGIVVDEGFILSK